VNDQILSLAELIWLKAIRPKDDDQSSSHQDHIEEGRQSTTQTEAKVDRGLKHGNSNPSEADQHESVDTDNRLERSEDQTTQALIEVTSTQELESIDDHEAPVISELQLPFTRVQLDRALHRIATWREEVTQDELNLNETVQQTARNGGIVTLIYQQSKRQDTQVIFIEDRSPSMTPWRECCQQLSSHLITHQSFAGVTHLVTDLSSSTPQLTLLNDQSLDQSDPLNTHLIRTLDEVSRIAEKLLILVYTDGTARSLVNRRFARVLRGLSEPYELVFLNPWCESQWQRNAVNSLFPTEPRAVIRDDTLHRAVPVLIAHPELEGLTSLADQRTKGKSTLDAIMLPTPRLIGEARRRQVKSEESKRQKRGDKPAKKGDGIIDYEFKVERLLMTLSPTSRELLVLSVTLPGLITTQLLLAIGQSLLTQILGLTPTPTEVRTALAEVLTSGLLRVVHHTNDEQWHMGENDDLYTFVNDDARDALRARVDPRSQRALERALLDLLNHRAESWSKDSIYHQIRVGLTLLDEPTDDVVEKIHELPYEMLSDLRSRVSSQALINRFNERIEGHSERVISAKVVTQTKPVVEEVPPTLKELEAILWNISDWLRSQYVANRITPIILTLLCYKRICDIWEEEVEELSIDKDRVDSSDLHNVKYKLPQELSFRGLLKIKSDIYLSIENAFLTIEALNPELDGILHAEYIETDPMNDDLLSRLLQQIDQINLRPSIMSSSLLCDTYFYLIGRFMSEMGKVRGGHATPRSLIELILRILGPSKEMSIYDPTCGTGGMLIEAARLSKGKGEDSHTPNLYGQELDQETLALCKMGFFLSGLDSSQLKVGDVLLEPKHLSPAGVLERFDLVIANPPFSKKSWGYESWSSGDSFNRDKYGCPPKSTADFAFIQHMLASLKPDGRMGVMVSNRVLSSSGREKEIRAALIQDDIIEAVIGLAPNLFYGTVFPLSIVVFNRKKTQARGGKILFVDATEELVKETRAQNKLSQVNIDRIVSAVQRFSDDKPLCRVVSVEHMGESALLLPSVRLLDFSKIRASFLKSFIGQEKLLQQLIKILERHKQREALPFVKNQFGIALIGQKGTGKSSYARWLIAMLSQLSDTPLPSTEVIALDLIEKKIKDVKDRIVSLFKSNLNGILFIDEFHELIDLRDSNQDQFIGQAVIDQVIAEMQKPTNRKTIVIIAGHPKIASIYLDKLHVARSRQFSKRYQLLIERPTSNTLAMVTLQTIEQSSCGLDQSVTAEAVIPHLTKHLENIESTNHEFAHYATAVEMAHQLVSKVLRGNNQTPRPLEVSDIIEETPQAYLTPEEIASINGLKLNQYELDTLQEFTEAMAGYHGHEEHLPAEFIHERDPIYQRMSDLIQEHLLLRDIKTRRLKRAKISQLFGFKHAFVLAYDATLQALNIDSAFASIIAVPHLWRLTPKGDPLLEELKLTEIWGGRENQLEQRRGLYVLLAYRLPTRRSMGGFTGKDFQDALRVFVARLKSLNIGEPRLFNLGQRTHIGIIAHYSRRVSLIAEPALELERTLECFDSLCSLSRVGRGNFP
jgi:type I restriction enzyme M protein